MLFLMCRVGEAKKPGPPEDATWSLGICNPSGLQGKHAMLSQVTTDILAVSETHLSKAGTRHLSASLRSTRSHFKHVLTGAPLPQRTLSSDAGLWSGVAFAAAVPCRTMAVPWPEDLYETSRLQFGSFYTPMAWVSGAVAYGYPEGKLHPQAHERTEAILDFAFEHLRQYPGPRFLCGDWNFTVDSLAVVSKLSSAGWIDVQDLLAHRTGAPVRPTCKGVSRKDYMFLSPELARAFLDLVVCDETFADHSVLVARFAGGPVHLERFVWPCPQPVPWTQVSSLSDSVQFAAPADPTEKYAELWTLKLPDTWVSSMKGRGQQTKPCRKMHRQAPLRASRAHEVQPAFFGFSAVHAKQFKQLRRLQNYCRWAENRAAVGCANVEHGIGLWTSILRAPGFAPSFSAWWPTRRYICPLDPVEIPLHCPVLGVAKQIFEAVLAEVRLLEQRLQQARATHRKYQHDHDRSLIFREVARPTAAPVETLIHSVKTQVIEVDVHDCAVVFDGPVDLDPQMPIWISGQPKEIIHADHDKAWLTDVDDVEPRAQVTQRQELGDLQAIFEAFHTQWKQRWCRHDNLPFTHWDAVVGFAQRVLRPCPVPHLSVDAALIQAEVQRKKKRSATGLDGVSRDDLLQADGPTLQSLASLYQRAETDGCWPEQLLAGKVHSLAKTESAATVSQYRPITVFGLPYRVWSSLQSRHLLQWAECWVDDGVYGNRRGRQASDLWHYLLQQIEHAYASGCPLSGVSADLEKCFNCIPRFPALCMAVLAGTPHQVTTAWAGSLAGMCRHFKVRDSFSAGFLTSTGLAEGCGLSVFGMLLVDHLFSCWMRIQAPAISTLSYVDDWQCLTWDPEVAVHQLAKIEQFAAMLDLTVDKAKTFGWSTDALVRAQLRGAGLSVCHHARELGGHFGISRQYTNRTVQQRIAGLDDFWPKLAQSKARYPAKIFMLRAVAWPRGLHAIPSAPLGDNVWTQLRRSALKALGWKRPGVNSFILLGLVESSVDPQFLALLWTCRAVRSQYAGDFGSAMLAPLAHGFLDLPPATLVAVVLARLQHVGLSVHLGGLVADRFGKFCLHTTNPGEVDLRLSWAWTSLVASKVSHRAEFAGLALADPASTKRALHQLGPDDQALVRLGLSGGLFTESYKAKWTDQTDTCIWCGQKDSLYHRYWACPQHQDLRDQLAPDAQQVIDSVPPALALRGWALHAPTWPAWVQCLLDLPTCPPSPAVQFKAGIVNHVFTDGSCLHQSDARFRVAAWAAVLVPSERETWTPGSSTVLCAAALAGLCQTAYRAELFAVAYVLHWASCQGVSVCVWTDCLGVINRYNLTFWGYKRINVNGVNADLWQWIQQSVDRLGREKIQLRKVPAHRTLQSATSRHELWMFYHNSLVDRAARVANQARPAAFWTLWERHVHASEAAALIFRQVSALHLGVARRHVRHAKADAMPAPVAEPRQTRQFEVKFDLKGWQGQPLPTLARLFGDAHVQRATRWFLARLAQGDSSTVVWVSFVQLYIDYQLCWGNAGPLRVNNTWVDAATRPYLAAEDYTFRQRVHWFRQMIKGLVKEAGIVAAFAQCRPRSEAVQTYMQSISLPWCGHALQEVDAWLLRNLEGPCVREGSSLLKLPLASKSRQMAV